MLPNFVVIGAAKSGSTFLSHCLEDHPEIYLHPQEMPVFESPDWEEQGIIYLHSLFDGRREKHLGVTRPSYIGKPEVPERISNYLPEARLIAVLRNPIDRAVSSYYHNMIYGFLPVRELERGMRLLLEGKYATTHPRSAEVLENGMYYKYLSQYRDYLDQGKLLVVYHEEVSANPVKVVQGIYQFLGVDASYVPSVLGTRPQAVQYNMHRVRLMALRNNMAHEYNKERTRLWEQPLRGMKGCLVKLIDRFDGAILAKVWENTKPKPSQALRNALKAVYQSDMEKLQTLLGRNLCHWK
ncbi:MAG: sulfotransferase domain-containing protein [Gemmataceae bacterium]